MESSKILYDRKKYAVSLAMSILAMEENAKLKLIHDFIEKDENLPYNRWRDFSRGGSHGKKIIKTSEDRREENKNLTYDTYLREILNSSLLGFDDHNGKSFEELKRLPTDKDYENIMKLNEVKKDCLYLNWKENTWFSIITESDKIQKAFARINLIIATSEFLNVVTNHKYRKTPNTPENLRKAKEDPNVKKLVEISKLKNSPEIMKYNQITLSFLSNKYFKN